MNSLKNLTKVIERALRPAFISDHGVHVFGNLRRKEIDRFFDFGLLEITVATVCEYLKQINDQNRVGSEQGIVHQATISDVCERVFEHLHIFFQQFHEPARNGRSTKRIRNLSSFGCLNHSDAYFIQAHPPIYSFSLLSGRRVHFHLLDGPRPVIQKSRRSSLVLAFPDHLIFDDSDLFIRFRFGAGAGRGDRAKVISEQILESPDSGWISETAHEMHEGSRQSILQYHLNNYISNLYRGDFVSADLAEDLKKRLDGFVKDEILKLDPGFPGIESLKTMWLEAAATKKIAEKIIELPVEIENSKKTFLLKKKFVLECNYCITLDKIPEKFYLRILSNAAQLEEWKRLFHLDGFESMNLRDYPFLMVDTKFFGEDFKKDILSGIENTDEKPEGLVVEGDNFEALQLLGRTYFKSVDCIYIDPPYNTGGSEFVYKDSYEGAAWHALMSSSLKAAKELLRRQGAICVSIDDHEATGLKNLMDEIFGKRNFISQIVIKSNPRGRQSEHLVAGCHEYLLAYAEHIQSCGWSGTRLSPGRLREYKYLDDTGRRYRRLGLRARGAASLRSERPNLFYPIYVDPLTLGVSLTRTPTYTVEVIPKKSDGREGRWAWSKRKVSENNELLEACIVNGTRHDIFVKDYLADSKRTKHISVWDDKELNYQNGKTELKNLFGESPFPYAKPCRLIKSLISSFPADSIVLDFFAGSGTTAQAVLDENRNQDANRSYILVEACSALNRVIIDRIKKTVFSSDWKDGNPCSNSGMSHFFKYMKLESFHDAVENIIRYSDAESNLLPGTENELSLRYVQGEEKHSLPKLNMTYFRKPFAMKMRSARCSGETAADVIETFNYLLGLRVTRISRDKGMEIVSGTLVDGRSATIIWRDCDTADSASLTEWLMKSRLDNNEVVYVNGKLPESLKVKQTETKLSELMFGISDDAP